MELVLSYRILSIIRLNDNSNFSDLFTIIASSSNSKTEFEDCIDMSNQFERNSFREGLEKGEHGKKNN